MAGVAGKPPLSEKAEGYIYRTGLGDNDKNPREESFWDMVHLTFCPTFKFMSFLFIVSVVNLICYTVSLTLDGIDTQGQFLSLKLGNILDKFGMRPTKIINDYQLWRLITPIFLHLNLSHIVMNSFTLVFWGSMVEYFIEWKKCAIIYLFAGICGNMISAIFSSNTYVSVGASGAITGVIMALLGMYILAYKALGHPALKKIREMMCCMVMMVVMFNFIFSGLGSATNSKEKVPTVQIDHYAHIGGGIGGALMALSIMTIETGDRKDKAVVDYENKCRLIGRILSVVYVLGTGVYIGVFM